MIKPTTLPPGLLSPSLQAIITSHASQQRSIKREKTHESISGKIISAKCSLVTANRAASSSKVAVTPSSHSHSLRGSVRGREQGEMSEQSQEEEEAAEHDRHSSSSSTGSITTPTTTPTGANTMANTTVTSSNNTNSSKDNDLSPRLQSAPPPSSSSPSPPSLPSSAPHTSSSDESTSSSGGSEDDQPSVATQDKHPVWSPPQATPLTSHSPVPNASSAQDTPSPATALVCSESLPGLVLKTLTTSLPPSYTAALSLLAEPAAQSLLSLSTSTPALTAPYLHTSPSSGSALMLTGPSDHAPQGTPGGGEQAPEHEEKKEDLSKRDEADEMDVSPVCSEVNSMELDSVHTKSLDSVSGFGSGSGSASEREGSPLPHERTSKIPSGSPEGKRKWRPCDEESREEYERRKIARHAEMNFTLDFGEFMR